MMAIRFILMINKHTLTRLAAKTWACIAVLFWATSALAQSPIPVQVRTLSEVLVASELTAPANVEALNQAVISSEVNAQVSRILVNVGQQVKKGAVLLELDATDYQLAIKQAEANLASSQAQKAQADARVNRARELDKKQYISADDLLGRETDVMVIAAQIQVQQAALSIARRNLDKCRILAKFDGVVEQRMAQLGAYVTVGSPLLELTQTDRLELDAKIPDDLASSLEIAVKMDFVSRGESWPVRLLRISPVVDRQGRSQLARFEFTSEAPAIGRSGEIKWQVDKALLPVNLVVRRDGQLGVFLNRDNQAIFTPLPGAQEGRPVEVNLPLDSQIVVLGRERLQDGDAIAPGNLK